MRPCVSRVDIVCVCVCVFDPSPSALAMGLQALGGCLCLCSQILEQRRHFPRWGDVAAQRAGGRGPAGGKCPILDVILWDVTNLGRDSE